MHKTTNICMRKSSLLQFQLASIVTIKIFFLRDNDSLLRGPSRKESDDIWYGGKDYSRYVIPYIRRAFCLKNSQASNGDVSCGMWA